MRIRRILACLISLAPAAAQADQASALRADSHAPIGVMADHTHSKGEWMISYRYMHMAMEENRLAREDITPEEIVSTQGNPNAPPPNLRVVPLEMTMQMHMLGAMYAPGDKVTLMVMIPHVALTMDHLTFQGGMGTNRLGEFTTESSGIGDVRLGGLFSLPSAPGSRFHVTAGLSLPTGAIDDADEVLTPMNTRPTLRLPYPMQVGSGTVDFLNGATYAADAGHWGYGVQYAGTWRLGRNDEGWSRGDVHALTGWGSYLWTSGLSTSLRLAAAHSGSIDGRDPQIGAPVQTADPDRQGGWRADIGVGLNLAWAGGHRFALEFSRPVFQDLNGPQLKTDASLTGGYQLSF